MLLSRKDALCELLHGDVGLRLVWFGLVFCGLHVRSGSIYPAFRQDWASCPPEGWRRQGASSNHSRLGYEYPR